MNFSWRKELPTLVILGVWFLAAAIYWPHAPDRIPSHMGFTGEIDSYQGKFIGLLLGPLICLATNLLFFALPYWDKNLKTDSNAAKLLPIFRLILTIVMALTVLVVILRGLYPHLVQANLMPTLVSISFILFGNFLGKARPNKFIGVRTPWTFKSKLSWVGSNRFGGWMMVGYGVSLILIAFVWPQSWFIFLMGGSLVLPAVIVGYSYYLFRNDPDPIPPF